MHVVGVVEAVVLAATELSWLLVAWDHRMRRLTPKSIQVRAGQTL